MVKQCIIILNDKNHSFVMTTNVTLYAQCVLLNNIMKLPFKSTNKNSDFHISLQNRHRIMASD